MKTKDFYKAIISFYKKNPKLYSIFIAAILGIILVVSTYIPNENQTPENMDTYDNLTLYTKTIEEKLSKTVSSINGAGKTTVMVTLDSSFETIYANNAKLDEVSRDSDNAQITTEKSLALTNSSKLGENPVVVKTISPKIKGVLIVCEGGENANIKQKVISAASTVLNISSSRVYVTGGKNNE